MVLVFIYMTIKDRLVTKKFGVIFCGNRTNIKTLREIF